MSINGVTMRKLVKLAYAKREKAENDAQRERTSITNNRHLRKSQTMGDVRVMRGRGISTEQKVAHRLSLQQNDHVRSISLPKSSAVDSSLAISVECVNGEDENTDNKHQASQSTQSQSAQTAELSDSVATEKSVDVQLQAHMQANYSSSYNGQALNPANWSPQPQRNLRPTHLKDPKQGSLYSVASVSSTYPSTSYEPSSTLQTKLGANRMSPPTLETVNEPSNPHVFADEQFQKKARLSIDLGLNLPEKNETKTNTNPTSSTNKNLHIDHTDSTNNAFWNCLCCTLCCCASASSPPSNVAYSSAKRNVSRDNTIEEHSGVDHMETIELDAFESENNDRVTTDVHGAGVGLTLDPDDWRTYKSGASRLRRPTQYTTITNNEDSTINPADVRTWLEPFGRGASGRIFKGVYLPLCQVMALKVTSRLDNENVTQILGEYRQQQEYLPECDNLMRIHGWYRNMQKNEIAVALEYMDMGSIYDSCFSRDRKQNNETLSPDEEEKAGHVQCTIHKITYEQLRYIARHILLGLYALHTNEPNLIHRDIKPQNVLISSYGEVKIADFGLLLRLPNGRKYATQSAGTRKYFSPERIDGKYGCSSDIWSYAITLIEVYKQELISADQLDFFKILEYGIDISEHLPVSAPTEFVEFLKKCLTHDESKRPTAKELLSHPFICRKWGNPLAQQNDNNLNLKSHLIPFIKPKGDQKMLDKLLLWLEEWVLEDEEKNAKLFLEGDSEYLRQCVFNLSKYTGCTPHYISNYVNALYHEYIK